MPEIDHIIKTINIYREWKICLSEKLGYIPRNLDAFFLPLLLEDLNNVRGKYLKDLDRLNECLSIISAAVNENDPQTK